MKKEFKKGNYVMVKEVYLSPSTFKSVILKPRPKRLKNCVGKITNIFFSPDKKTILYAVHFLHSINMKRGYVSEETQLFFRKELKKAGSNARKKYKKLADLMYAKELAVKL